MKETYWTVQDAARFLDKSGECVRVYERTGKLPAAIKSARGVRLFRKSDVEAFAARQAEKLNKYLRSETGSVASGRPRLTKPTRV